VRNTVIGLNFVDIYNRRGTLPVPEFPTIIGDEASGVVEGEDQRGIEISLFCQTRSLQLRRWLAAVRAKGEDMKIGIIGAGNIGSALTRRLTAAGHQVFVANSRGPQTLTTLAAETGAKPVYVKEAAYAGDVVVVTIPEKHISSLPVDLLKDVPASVVVIDTGNYYPRQRDGRIDAIENGMPESQWVAQQLGRPMIKAFNNISAAHLQNFGLPADTAGRVAIPVAGDDPKAKAIVFRLVDEIGFDPVDAGSLAESWRQQPGTPVYLSDFVAAAVQRALSQASRERPVEFRAEERKGTSA
jgi:predicted dinucleotide-binding enzyme